MFENLRNELSKKRISNKAVADLIGCTQKTLDNKLNGVTEFTLSEILLISDNLLPEFERANSYFDLIVIFKFASTFL